jgi:hypothetical protein
MELTFATESFGVIRIILLLFPYISGAGSNDTVEFCGKVIN